MAKKALLIFLFSLSFYAQADVIPDEVESCHDKNEGDKCQLLGRSNFHCEKAKCSRLDYSQGTPPKSMRYDCLKCIENEDSPGGCSNVSTGPTLMSLGLGLIFLYGLRRRA